MRSFTIPILLTLSACSLSPALDKPALPVPAVVSAIAGLGTQDSAVELEWRTRFGDRRLRRLIELALANNRDLRLATLNAETVQAQYGIQRAARFPAIDATGSAARQRTAANAETSPAVSATVQNQYGLSLGLSAFEIDLFGRVRSLSDAALARYLASDQGRRSARIALVGAVADAHFAERLAQEQRQLAERTLADWQQSLDLARRLKERSQTSGLDVVQAEGQLATAKVDLEARIRAMAQARNALQLLIGVEQPGDLPDPLPLEGQAVTLGPPAGLPSALLLRRPDILQAEQTLIAANADIGAARAAFFPRLSLTTSLGYVSPAMAGLFGADQGTWSFAPQITLPLFQGGRLDAELRLAELRKSAAVAEYERAIQIAFREVADGLAGQATFGRQLEAQTLVVASAERRAALSGQRYRAGVEGRLELLDSQRQLYAARQALLNLRRDALSNAVALYKALGGAMDDEPAAPSLGHRVTVEPWLSSDP
ncbi:efflux transporter outer membrane subunit [Azospirillum doebereinerae]|uniref:efflux transporter outer membrane subunit n=1 Tax=Azospirillum doebereinerae TaxID=92933 RepID=UPI001EE60E9D|nr:efflux transporter outer membrane subunit [Azospirillum doebereinerae]MCG5243631.1 efflux transporter outer membrane subunit [Azospirillum doebereinerae]